MTLRNELSCRVTHGANDGTFLAAGKTIGLVRRALGTAYNIPANAEAIIDGIEVDEDHRLRPGDHLEWVRRWGWKGGTDDEHFIKSGDALMKLNEILFRIRRLEEALGEHLKQQAPSKDFYSVEEFGKLVALAPYTVREHCRLSRLRAEKAACGRGNIPEWRIPHAELVRYRSHGLLPIRKNGG